MPTIEIIKTIKVIETIEIIETRSVVECETHFTWIQLLPQSINFSFIAIFCDFEAINKFFHSIKKLFVLSEMFRNFISSLKSYEIFEDNKQIIDRRLQSDRNQKISWS